MEVRVFGGVGRGRGGRGGRERRVVVMRGSVVRNQGEGWLVGG